MGQASCRQDALRSAERYSRQVSRPQCDQLPDFLGPKGQGGNADLVATARTRSRRPPTCSARSASARRMSWPTSCPTANETVLALLGGATAGIVNPINPLLDAEQIGSILRETKAKVVVTLRPFPKTDVAEKAAEAVALAPNVKTVLEVDLLRYLTPPEVLDRAADPAQANCAEPGQIHEFQWRKSPSSRRRSPSRTCRRTVSPAISTQAAPRACPRSRSTSIRAWSTTAGSARGCSLPKMTTSSARCRCSTSLPVM